MDNFLDVVSVPLIATAVYWIINFIKLYVKESERFKRIIPIIASILGAGIGCILFYCAPILIPANNVFMALVMGGASGLTATGTNQIFKQMKKTNNKNCNG